MTATMTQPSDSPAMRPATLPTTRMIVSAVVHAMVAGLVWLLATMWWKGASIAMLGPIGAGIVSVGVVVGLTSVSPWKPRPLASIPMIWLLGSVVRMVATLGLTFLLYSAAPALQEKLLWIAVVVAWGGASVGEVKVYKEAMKPFTPGFDPSSSASTDVSGSSSS